MLSGDNVLGAGLADDLCRCITDAHRPECTPTGGLRDRAVPALATLVEREQHPLTGLSCLCIALRDLAPYFRSIDIGNAVTIAGYVLMFVAIRVILSSA